MDGKSHPLPRSDEARHNEIPEHFDRDKGRGDDARALNQPEDDPVTPDGEPYRYADLGRGPGSGRQAGGGRGEDELKRGQAEHQDRGQGVAEAEAGEGRGNRSPAR